MLSYGRMRKDERKTCASLAARAFMDYEYFASMQNHGGWRISNVALVA